MNATQDCIFCAIAAGKSPTAIIYEDRDTLAFLDIYPVAEGHTLVIPKAHVRTAFDMDDHTGCTLMRTVRIVSNALRATGLGEGLNILQSNEAVGGQDIFHLHFHLIPRKASDGIMVRTGRDRIFNWIVKREPSFDELRQTALRIHDTIARDRPDQS